MNAKSKYLSFYVLLTLFIMLLAPLPAISQDHGSGGGHSGGGGCGDVFGDLIHILRDDLTGQPILAQRWVELPAEAPGYGWGYCPIALSSEGEELPFAPYSCDVHPDFVEDVVEVDYFGRLNGGRTKERNNRMHLDEVISNIKAADLIMTNPSNRLTLGYGCREVNGKFKLPCEEMATIDSPMEHMGLYSRIAKYGHLGTDPYEIDTFHHGDPKMPTQFHVALDEEDFAKFPTYLRHLLPNNGKNPAACWDYSQAEDFEDLEPKDGKWNASEPFLDRDEDCEWDGADHEPFVDVDLDGEFDYAEPFTDSNGNCVRDEFVYTCAGAEQLKNSDFISAAVSMASAASKTGIITVHLVQYFNRILKIAKDTAHTVSAVDTLPALYLDCWASEVDPVLYGEGPWETDLDYDDSCQLEAAIIPAKSPDYDYCEEGTPNHCLFPDVQERFVDFAKLDQYEREGKEMNLLLSTTGNWAVEEDVDIDNWVEAVNGEFYEYENIDGFVSAASDFLRTIEYIHNYEIPVILECVYETDLCDVR